MAAPAAAGAASDSPPPPLLPLLHAAAAATRTLAIVKPDAFDRAQEILHLAELAGFTILCRKRVQASDRAAVGPRVHHTTA
jgi:hypothetical protein